VIAIGYQDDSHDHSEVLGFVARVRERSRGP
jgi:hypothetical protein